MCHKSSDSFGFTCWIGNLCLKDLSIKGTQSVSLPSLGLSTVVSGCLICHRGNKTVRLHNIYRVYPSSLCFLAYPAGHYGLASGRRSRQSWPWTAKAARDLSSRTPRQTHALALPLPTQGSLHHQRRLFYFCSPQPEMMKRCTSLARGAPGLGDHLEDMLGNLSLSLIHSPPPPPHTGHRAHAWCAHVLIRVSDTYWAVNVSHHVSATVITPAFYYCCCLLSSFHHSSLKHMILFHTVSESIIRNSECEMCLSLCI